MKVRLYRNLHKPGHAWSIQAREGSRKGKVIAVVGGAVLRDARFVVNEGGRQRVIREKRKNVHAYVEGDLVSTCGLNAGDRCCPIERAKARARVSYNPYKRGAFVRGSRDLERAPIVVACSDGVYAAPRRK